MHLRSASHSPRSTDGRTGVLLAAHVEGAYDGSPPGPKQFVWIHGANHNFWNTSWFDLTVPFGDDGAAAGVPNRITAAQQQDLARGYGGAFLRGYVAAEAALLDYFRFAASQVPPAPIAATAVHLQYQVREADLARVDDFETNDALDTTSEGVAGVDTATLVGPDEIELTGARTFVPAATQSWCHNTRGLLFEWNAATDFYETVLPAGSRDVSGFEVLSFRIAQDRRHAASGTEPVVRVQLEDGMGENSSVITSTVTNIPVHQVRTDDALLTKSMLKTIRLQLCLFEERNADLDLTDIRKIRFTFFSRATGKAGIDDIEFAE